MLRYDVLVHHLCLAHVSCVYLLSTVTAPKKAVISTGTWGAGGNDHVSTICCMTLSTVKPSMSVQSCCVSLVPAPKTV